VATTESISILAPEQRAPRLSEDTIVAIGNAATIYYGLAES